MNHFFQVIQSSIELKKSLLTSRNIEENTLSSVQKICSALTNGNQILFCGNGGSAGDAQHIAAELSGRFYFDRPPLNAEALHVNSSYLTAVANDYSFDVVYERMIEARGKSGDVLVGISTSGNSKNVVLAMKKAQELGMITIGLTGESGGEMKNCSDILINVPSNDTPRIQECHIMIGHIICEIVEEKMFPKK
jgi:D-sedoheptulose 7-phosphate isomerase